MAARSNKIFGEVLFKQHKYKPKIVSPISRNVRHLSQNLTKNTNNPFVTAQVRLNEIIQNSKLNKNPADPYLQPALLPTFVGHRNKKNDYVTTLPLIHQMPKATKPIYTIPKRKTNVGVFNPTKIPLKLNQNRQYSTILSSTRNYSSSKNWGNQADAEKCDTRRECFKGCPKWQMTNCPPQGDNLECNRPYFDPCCKKKPAPYPSFSETCAERLDDDPSECMQCPWKRCGGVNFLKYPKRRYHTATQGAFHRFKMTTLPLLKITETILPFKCDAKKPPCRRPPGKCDKVKKTVECPKKKGPCPPPFERKKCNREPKKANDKWTDAYKMWTDKNNIVLMKGDVKDMPVMTSTREADDDCRGEMVTPGDCCRRIPFDKRQTDYEYVCKRQCYKPTSKRKKRKTVPDSCIGSCNKKCANPTLFEIFYECHKNKCPKDKCQRRICPNRHLPINNFMELSREQDKRPPCPSWRKPSKQCPKPEKCRKPYRQEHDLTEPVYRRAKKPYPDIETGHGERRPDTFN